MDVRPGDFWVRGSALPFFLLFYISHFLETPWFQGVFSLLFGAFLCSRECVGIPGAVRACAMRLIHEFKVHSLLLLFSRAFYVYLLLFRSLQYIYQSLYSSYPSVCLCRSQRQPESYSLSCLDHANNLRSLVRFQHKRMPVLSGWVSLIYTPLASLSGFVPPPS